MIKDKIVELLDSDRDVYYSGEDMAARFNVTRAAVWKAVKSLQREGYQIGAAPNRGYCLAGSTDILSSPGIGKYLSAENRGLNIKVYGTADSTNKMIRREAAAGEAEGAVIVAGEQTGGRGRFGRTFYSPPGTGIYLSLLLRPSIEANKTILITTAAAVAVCEAIETASGKAARIKWVNDIHIDGGKVCGILTEGALGLESGVLEYAALGIGVNVYAPAGGFPDEIEGTAGAIFETPQSDMRNRLAAEILNRFMGYYSALERRGFTEEYRRRSLVIGRRVTVLSHDGALPATALDVDDDCRLKVRYDDGREEYLCSGEISVKIPHIRRNT